MHVKLRLTDEQFDGLTSATFKRKGQTVSVDRDALAALCVDHARVLAALYEVHIDRRREKVEA